MVPDQAGYGGRDLRSDVPNLLKLFLGCGHQGVECAIGLCETFCRLLSDVADAESEDQAVQRRALCLCDGREQIGRRFFGHPLQAEELLFRQEEEIGRVMDQAGCYELRDHLFSQPFDVQRPA